MLELTSGRFGNQANSSLRDAKTEVEIVIVPLDFRRMSVRKGGRDRPGPNDRFGNLVFYCGGQEELKTQVSIETCKVVLFCNIWSLW